MRSVAKENNRSPRRPVYARGNEKTNLRWIAKCVDEADVLELRATRGGALFRVAPLEKLSMVLECRSWY